MVALILLPIVGVKSQKKTILGAWISVFKPNARNIQTFISLQTRNAWQSLAYSPLGAVVLTVYVSTCEDTWHDWGRERISSTTTTTTIISRSSSTLQSLPVYHLWRDCMVVVIFFVTVVNMTGRKIGSHLANVAVTTRDPSDLMQSPPISGFVQTPQRSVVARCTPIQSMSSDVTLYSPSTGKYQVCIWRVCLIYAVTALSPRKTTPWRPQTWWLIRRVLWRRDGTQTVIVTTRFSKNTVRPEQYIESYITGSQTRPTLSTVVALRPYILDT